MMRGDFTNLSERKLMDCLTRLGYDIEIKVRAYSGERDRSFRLNVTADFGNVTERFGAT